MATVSMTLSPMTLGEPNTQNTSYASRPTSSTAAALKLRRPSSCAQHRHLTSQTPFSALSLVIDRQQQLCRQSAHRILCNMSTLSSRHLSAKPCRLTVLSHQPSNAARKNISCSIAGHEQDDAYHWPACLWDAKYDQPRHNKHLQDVRGDEAGQQIVEREAGVVERQVSARDAHPQQHRGDVRGRHVSARDGPPAVVQQPALREAEGYPALPQLPTLRR